MEAQPKDRAIGGILATNLVTLVMAVWQQWSVLELMWPFWMQSVIIGWYARRRIMALKQFSTKGLKINDRPVNPTRQTRRWVATSLPCTSGSFTSCI